MEYVRNMLETHPRPAHLDNAVLVACIEACFACEQVCTACADACLAEGVVDNLRRCIRLNLDCADLCAVTGRVLSRQTEPDWEVVRAQVETCARVCRVCGDECEQHAGMHEHCRVCMESCRRCEEACRQLLGQLRSITKA